MRPSVALLLAVSLAIVSAIPTGSYQQITPNYDDSAPTGGAYTAVSAGNNVANTVYNNAQTPISGAYSASSAGNNVAGAVYETPAYQPPACNGPTCNLPSSSSSSSSSSNYECTGTVCKPKRTLSYGLGRVAGKIVDTGSNIKHGIKKIGHGIKDGFDAFGKKIVGGIGTKDDYNRGYDKSHQHKGKGYGKDSSSSSSSSGYGYGSSSSSSSSSGYVAPPPAYTPLATY